MFRVHYSSHDLAESRGDFYIPDMLHHAWSVVKKQMILRKSYGLYHIGENETFPIREWAPEAALNPPIDNPWYDQFEGPEGIRAHHPPFGHDFKTGELLYSKKHGDGRPESMHPLDYMIYDMTKRLEKAVTEQGRPDMWNKKATEQLFQIGIDKHNLTADQPLAPINSVLWRLNTATGFDGDAEKSARQTHSPDGRQYNYSTNQGNLHDLRGADTGMWIDGGIHPMWESTKGAYDVFREFYRTQGIELPPSDTMSYLTGPKVRLQDLTFQRVQPMSREEAQKHFLDPQSSGMHPKHKSGKALENYHALDVIDFMPNALFSRPTGNKGARSRTGKQGEDPKTILNRAQEIKYELEKVGIPINDEDAIAYAEMPISQFIIGGDRHQVQEGNQGPAILRNIAQQLGVDMNSSRYQSVLSSIGTRKGDSRHRGLKQSRHLYAIPWVHAMNLFDAGKADTREESWQMATEQFRNIDYEHKNTAYTEGNREKYRAFADQMKETPAHSGQMTRATGKLPEPHNKHPDHAIPSEVPPHWLPHIDASPTGVSPASDKAKERTGQMLAENTERPPPPRQAVEETAAPTRMDEVAALRQQLAGIEEAPLVGQLASAALPQEVGPRRASFQQRLDDGSFVLSEERTVSDLLKTMERIQLKEARQDSVVKSLVQYRSLITKSDDVSEVAQSLGISVMDVHGIYHSHGDWHRVANDWNVGPEIVKAVKVTFGGGV